MNEAINIALRPIGTGNEWCLYLLLETKEDSEFIEDKLGNFDLYLSVNPQKVTIIIKTLPERELITFYAPVNTIQYPLIKDRRVTHIASTYADKYPLPDNRIFSVVPKYQAD